MGTLEPERVNQLLSNLKDGSNFTKVSCKRFMNSTKQCRFQVSKDEFFVTYSPSKKEDAESQVEIEDIQEIRQGKNTDRFRDISKYPSNLCFSIILNGETRILNLVAGRKEEAARWIKGLRILMKKSDLIDARDKQAMWIAATFEKADRNSDGALDSKEVLKLLEKLNVKVDKDHALRLFNLANVTRGASSRQEDGLDKVEFVTFYREITKRPEINAIFDRFAENKDLTADKFLQFMHQTQKRQDVDSKWCSEIINKYEPIEEKCKNGIMTIDGFTLYLLSEDASVFNPACNRIYQDMTRPLTHYFISSSHNTYLLEDQLKGPSSTEAYISALQKGCRCVELDVWDGPDDNPVIYHGHTLTSKILLEDAMKAIKDYAFVSTDYPLILSFENHCGLEQQKVMAQIVEDSLGDMLFRLDSPEDMTSLPSPDELKKKILIKGKKLPTVEDDGGDVSDEDEAADIEDGEAKEEKHKEKKKVKLAKEFSDIVYLGSCHFKGVDAEMGKRKPFEMSSFVESKCLDLAKESTASAFTKYNAHFLSRIYPGGLRTNSSNYSPLPMWNVGAQIVALNFQTDCEEMDIYLGKFLDNGNCGYVLKPDFMLPGNKGSMLKPFQLKVKLISGQQLPKSSKDVSDPYVKVTMHETGDDEAEYKSEVKDNNGFNPMWNFDMKFKIVRPEMTLLRFEVIDRDISSKDDFIAQYTLPVTCMEEGYHHVPLRSIDGQDLSPASLFVHVTKIGG